MRALPLCLLTATLALSGCSLLPRETAPLRTPVTNKTSDTPAKPQAVTPHQTPVALYESAEDLIGKPFRDLGEISGSICQTKPHHNAPSLTLARKRMLHNAAQLKANAVLLHGCHILHQTDGCYRQAVCTGSALNISASAQ